MLKTTLKKLYTSESVYEVSEVPGFEVARAGAFSFGSDWPEQQRDGARDGGELLGVAEIVVRVGRDGGTFVLLYLPWAERHSISQPCFFAIERLLVN